MDRSQMLGQRRARERQLVVSLQSQPELGFHVKKTPRRAAVSVMSALACDNFPKTALRYADFLGQPILGHAHWLEKFIQQVLP